MPLISFLVLVDNVIYDHGSDIVNIIALVLVNVVNITENLNGVMIFTFGIPFDILAKVTYNDIMILVFQSKSVCYLVYRIIEIFYIPAK